MKSTGEQVQEPTSSEKDSMNTSEQNQSTSQASDSSNENANNGDSSPPTPGTDEAPIPTITIFFEPLGIRLEMNEAVNSLNIAILERATLQLRREVMRARRRLAHQKPGSRNSEEQVTHVA